MEGLLQQSTAVTVTVLIVSSTDHISGKTGLSAGLTIYATKAGGTPAAITPTVAELSAANTPGLYSLALTTTHTNTLGELQLHITGTGADPTDLKWQVTSYLPGDFVSAADVLLDRNMATGTDSGSPTVRTVRQALRPSRNLVSISAGTYTVYKEDDTTVSWTGVATTTAGANPVTQIDPA